MVVDAESPRDRGDAGTTVHPVVDVAVEEALGMQGVWSAIRRCRFSGS